MAADLDAEVTALARRIAELGAGERSKVFRMSFWSERMLDWAMARPAFKTQLFRFVDVFPAMVDDADVARHLHEYFEGQEVPKALDLGIDVAGHVPFGKAVEARVARKNIARMAEQFIVGTTPDEAVEGLHELWRQGSAATVDLLGEKTIVGPDADRYAARVHEMLTALCDATTSWAPDDHLERDDLGPIPRVNVSIKPTALAAHYEPLTRDEGLRQASERLRPLLRLARDRGATVHFDMEHADAKDLTLRLFRDLLGEDEFADLDAGIVIQAYLRDSRDDLADLIAWSAQRSKPITVRLVKGAYWDTETVHAKAAGWPVPVFEHKDETDANYERCARLLQDHHGSVRAAFASHNLRSLAYAITYGRSLGIADTGYEIQMLYGMAEPMHAAIRRLGLRLRVYAPVGQLVPGMAYLVRRLLENTSNESFVRHRFAEGAALDGLIAAPKVDDIPAPTAPQPPPPTDAADPSPYQPEPVREWRRRSARAAFEVAVERADRSEAIDVPAVIDGARVRTAGTIESVDPAHWDRVVATSAACGASHADDAVAAALAQADRWRATPAHWDRVVATSASCGASHADDAVAAALAQADRWRATPARERAAVLFGAAGWMRERRDQLSALEVFEAGKPWAQADGDVCEAIDFCEYYGREMLRLDRGGAVQSPPGEANSLTYQGKGVGVVIAPWNFPLAIPTGMTVAALVTGNPVVLKPAEQTPAIAFRLVEALEAGGLPKGVLGFLPGWGEEVGARLVEHRDVSFVVFTGSRPVGLTINEVAARHQPGQRHIKRVIAELGGKNPLIVDGDADPDQVVPAVIESAFGFAGQKCSALSRLIVLDHAYDAVVPRVIQAAAELQIGHPARMGTQIGPVIDADAHRRLTKAIEEAPAHGTVAQTRTDLPDGGWYVGPTVVTDVDPAAPLATDELFGPVLAVFRVPDMDRAIELANATDYALTAGIFSRSPATIRRAAAELRAGNIYVNRGITGAVVGRQPFGGYGLSGVGSKAGGPDYLLQFVDPRTLTENTLRQGFAPEG